MYKLGDNRCIEIIDEGDMTKLKTYLRESIFSKEKRKLDIEVFFWVLWSNFKRKVQKIVIEEEKESIFDEIRVFGFKSDFFQVVFGYKVNPLIKADLR